MSNGHRRAGLALALCVAYASPVRAGGEPLAYVRGSSQQDRETNKKTYHPLNLLDDDPATAWCEGKEGVGEGERVTFFFKRAQRIDRIVVAPALDSGRRVQVVKISDGTNTVRIPLNDAIVEQPLRKPMKGKTFTVSIDEVGGPNKGSSLKDDVACISDVLLYLNKRPFGGRLAPNKMRYNEMRDKVLGRWSGEPFGAPEKFITFALDGTWVWTFEPLLEGRRAKLSGEYRFRGNRLLMRKGETGRWSDMRFKYERTKVDPTAIGAPMGDYDRISVNGAVDDRIAGHYNNAEF